MNDTQFNTNLCITRLNSSLLQLENNLFFTHSEQSNFLGAILLLPYAHIILPTSLNIDNPLVKQCTFHRLSFKVYLLDTIPIIAL